MNVLEPPFFFTFHLKRALFEFSSLPLSFSLFSSSSFFSKLAQARSPQLDVRLRPAPPRHRRLDRAVGLRGRDVNVVVELFVVSFFLSDFGGERGVSEEKKKTGITGVRDSIVCVEPSATSQQISAQCVCVCVFSFNLYSFAVLSRTACAVPAFQIVNTERDTRRSLPRHPTQLGTHRERSSSISFRGSQG